MKKISLFHRSLIHSALGGICNGLFMALQATIFLEKGLESWQLAFIYATLMFSTALFELPLGSVADNYGRLRVYRVSQLMLAFAYLFAFFSHGFFAMLFFALIMGLSRALSSGTVSAWFFEELQRQNLSEKYAEYNAKKQSVSLFFVIITAFSAGFIPYFAESYLPQPLFAGTQIILFLIAVIIFVEYVALFWVYHEGEDLNTLKERRLGLLNTIKAAWGNLSESSMLKQIIFFNFIILLIFGFLESYWQAFTIENILGEANYKLFGMITAGYFGAQLAGSLIAGKIASKQINFMVFAKVTLLIAGLILVMLSLTRNMTLFIVLYYAIILFPVMAAPFLGAIAAQEMRDENRSTLISLMSFINSLNAGIMMAIVPFFVKYFSIATLFATSGVLASLIMGLFLLKKK